jgi:UDP-glucose 4-epimerase
MALDTTVPAGIYNLGTSAGTSNQQIIDAAERITGRKLKIQVGTPRAGDPAVLTASAEKFNSICPSWQMYSLDDMITHAWAWYNRK